MSLEIVILISAIFITSGLLSVANAIKYLADKLPVLFDQSSEAPFPLRSIATILSQIRDELSKDRIEHD